MHETNSSRKTGKNGLNPSLSTPDGSLTTDLTHVVYTRDRNADARLYINGVEVKRKNIRGDFSNWNDDMRLGLANEITRNRPWLGEYHLLAIYSRALGSAEVNRNFSRGTLITPTVDFTALAQFFKDLTQELARLVPQTFIALYDLDRLVHLERYIKAVGIRAQRANIDFEKDKIKSEKIRPFHDSLKQLLEMLSSHASLEKRNAIEEYFWMVEEYKVSIFAQELKAAIPISKKRLTQKLKQIQRMV